MNTVTLLLITTLSIPANVLVLRSGQQIDISSAHEEDGRIVFRTPNGALYSLPANEVDLTASRATATIETHEHSSSTPAARKLKASEIERKRLIADLEQNHSGPATPSVTIEPIPAAPTLEAVASQTEDEWNWRDRARSLQEAVDQARENRDLLASKAGALRSHIAGLLSLGYKPSQFSYDTTVLADTVEQIPYAELQVTRAERALADFREEARRRGIQPGWVR
jgi:hypothetical protein